MQNKVSLLQSEWFLYCFAILASIFLSTWISTHQALINPDAICYLLSAQMIKNEGIRSAMNLCGQAQWPFYSILISGVTYLTHLSYSVSAYLLNAIFSALSVLAFILIVKELGGNRGVMWLAAIVMLLAHQFNTTREYIIRDHGFWAFYLGSILFLLRYMHKPVFSTALKFNMCMLIAALFRVEGIIFLLTIPCLVWFLFNKTFIARCKMFLSINLVTLCMVMFLILWVLLHPEQTLSKLGRLAEIPVQLQTGLTLIGERYQHIKAALVQYILTTYSVKQAPLLIFIMLINWYAISVMGTLSWIYAGLVIYAWQRQIANFSFPAKLVLTGYIAINVIITLSFLAQKVFLSNRYLIALSLVLMLWVPFALTDLIKHAKESLRYKVGLVIITFFMLISSLGGLFEFGYSKGFIKQAGKWIVLNIPASASLYSNDIQLMYYSDHFGNTIFKQYDSYAEAKFKENQWQQYDYLALRVNKHDAKLLAKFQQIKLSPLMVFGNKRGDSVFIFKNKPLEKMS